LKKNNNLDDFIESEFSKITKKPTDDNGNYNNDGDAGGAPYNTGNGYDMGGGGYNNPPTSNMGGGGMGGMGSKKPNQPFKPFDVKKKFGAGTKPNLGGDANGGYNPASIGIGGGNINIDDSERGVNAYDNNIEDSNNFQPRVGGGMAFGGGAGGLKLAGFGGAAGRSPIMSGGIDIS
jgi:hypothetical protein